jgi:hypothetical protein
LLAADSGFADDRIPEDGLHRNGAVHPQLHSDMDRLQSPHFRWSGDADSAGFQRRSHRLTVPLEHVSIGTAAMEASQSSGGAIFVTVANTLLQNHLLDTNNHHSLPGVNVRAIIEIETTRFREFVIPKDLPALIKLYNDSLQAVFIAAVSLCGCAFLYSLAMERKSVVRGHSDGMGA